MHLALILTFALLSLIPAHAQTDWNVQPYFQQVGLTSDQIASIMHRGEALAISLPTRHENEMFLFGAVYINATPADYLNYYRKFAHSREPGVLGTKIFDTPPQPADFQGFNLEQQDITSLKQCKPGKCEVMLPEGAIEKIHQRINWSAPNMTQQVNDFVQQTVFHYLENYTRSGGKALGTTLNGKGQPVSIYHRFDEMMSYRKVLPANPQFYNYLLSYPADPSPDTKTWFYWENVNFGLKPTLRLVQVFTMTGTNPAEPALSVAGKQLYATHYFETAVHFAFCYASSGNPNKPGMYLVQLMGSELSAPSGIEGSVVRRVATDKSVTDLRTALLKIKEALESPPPAAK